MKGNQEVIDALNAALHLELTAINLYFVQAKMFDKWGYRKLGAKQYSEAIEEMRHAETEIKRILFLEGTPIARTEQVTLGADVQVMFQTNLELEMKGVEAYNQGIATCLKVGDAGSREVLEHILLETEQHVEWLESQLHIISDIGLDNYLADQIGGEEDGEEEAA